MRARRAGRRGTSDASRFVSVTFGRFAELRTKQQLGYAVHSGLYDLGTGDDMVSGVYILILSKDFSPAHLHKAIDTYMRGFATGVLDELTTEEYATSHSERA